MCWTFHLPMCWASPLTDVLNPHPRFPCSAEKDNCSFLISNSSFPQGRINPPIRGSIVFLRLLRCFSSPYQSPYKGFNRFLMLIAITITGMCINPPIRGSIEKNEHQCLCDACINPPIRGSIGFIIMNELNENVTTGINPPIRGSIVLNRGGFYGTMWVSIPL